MAKGDRDQVFVVVDGPQSPDLERVVSCAPTYGFQLVRQTKRIGLVANWNACLQVGSNDLIHLMHADDAVTPYFYIAVRRAMEAHHVAMVAAGRFPVSYPSVEWLDTTESSGQIALLRGREAASYLLSRDKPPTGSFVLRRSVLGLPLRGFDSRYAYCPDEELYLRTLVRGDLALVESRLYLESSHIHQARYWTWHRADFADVYFAARVEGARAVGREVVQLARHQTGRRLFSVGRFLLKSGDWQAARTIVRSIAANDKRSMINWRYWALLILAAARRGSDRPTNGLTSRPVDSPSDS
jgi:hypothetical protein